MRRRLLLALVGLTAAILTGAVVPLGFQASAHDYRAYVEDAQSQARTAAAAAEELLVDHLAGSGLGHDLAAASRAGGSLAILSPGGGVIREAGGHLAVPRSVMGQAERSGDLTTAVANDRVLVVVPVRSRGSTVGVVALLRPTEQLEYSLRTFWLTLVLIAIGALAAAVLLASGLSRWVARPLAALDASARRLGDGDLSARAPVASWPAEFRRLADTFNTMAGRLETLVHGHRAVIADVSHQLRTPLAALRLRLDLLAPESGDDAADFAGALDEVARLSRLVDGLLAVARAENASPQAVTVRADQVVCERVAAWAPVAAERGIQLSSHQLQSVPALVGDGYLEQILDNLIANAVDAAGAGNHITVSATIDQRRARVVVADDGPGMSQAEMDRAFRRFATTSSTGGSGLGLAIVYRLAGSSGGSARLTRTDGGGLTVIVELPLASPASPGLAGRAASRAR
ncbi:MAG TPA: HAMP domain-containing sensor histidine kinase [Streptosporangiaceae bacterium]|nr:HAMP domain-containing sensor histidine kinase [Streptosporangiaceae bacterium]